MTSLAQNFFLALRRAVLPISRPRVGAGEDFDGVAGSFFDVAGFDQKAVDAVFDYFGDAADVGGDYGDFAGHGFESGQAEGFELGGKKEEIGGG